MRLTRSISKAAVLVATFAVALSVAPGLKAADALAPSEKIYADLFKMPADQRQAQIVEGAKKEGKLVLLPLLQGPLGRNHTKIFHDAYPFLKLEELDVSSHDMSDRIVSEETAGRHLTDAVSLSVTDMANVLTHKIPARYETPAEDKILPMYQSFKDPNHMWVPAFWKEHGLAYNSSMMSEDQAPKHWEDLCDPKYRGQVSFEPSDSSMLIGMYNYFGKDEKKLQDWLTCIGKNDPIVARGHTSRLMLMLAGDHEILGDTFLYRGIQLSEKNPKKAPFKVVFSAKVLAWPSVVVINKNATNPYAAALYTDWTFSDASQAFMAKEYRDPITVPNPYMPADAQIVTFGEVDAATLARFIGYWRTYVGDKR